jgi:transposase
MKIKPTQTREILRLLEMPGRSERSIAAMTSASRATVSRYRRRKEEESLSYIQCQAMDDRTLDIRLNPPRSRSLEKAMPNYDYVHQRMTEDKDVTLELMHQEYALSVPGRSYSTTQFNHYYRLYMKKVHPTLRLRHVPGEGLMVDYSGRPLKTKDRKTGKESKVEIFVSVLPYSGLIYVYASRSQKLADWIEAHIKAFYFYGGVTDALIPDNLRSAVTKAGKSPVINRSYQEMAAHYGVVVLPARVRRPQDKAYVEWCVRFVRRWMLTILARHTFFSVDAINTEIGKLLPRLNEKVLRRHKESRIDRFERAEREKLKPLPAMPYKYGEWTVSQKVNSGFHINVRGHAYSVPYGLIGKKVEARVTVDTVEIHHLSKLVMTHSLSHELGGMTTEQTHMPAKYRSYANRSLETNLAWALGIGESSVAVIKAQYCARGSESMIGNSACDNLRTLCRHHGSEDFEAACRLALEINSPVVKSVRSILKSQRFKIADDDVSIQQILPLHANVRGSDYYTPRIGGA